MWTHRARTPIHISKNVILNSKIFDLGSVSMKVGNENWLFRIQIKRHFFIWVAFFLKLGYYINLASINPNPFSSPLRQPPTPLTPCEQGISNATAREPGSCVLRNLTLKFYVLYYLALVHTWDTVLSQEICSHYFSNHNLMLEFEFLWLL